MTAAAFICILFCAGPDPAVVAGDTFCRVWNAVTRGDLKLTQTEVEGLRDETLRKIVALKRIAEKNDCAKASR